MAVNLVSALWRELTPEVVGRLALLLGVDARRARIAIAAAVPALLAGLVGTAAAPGGGARLALAASDHPHLAGDFDALLADGHHTSLIDAGTHRLTLLLGPTQDALATAVGDYAGIGAGTANALLGALAPLALGVLGKAAASAGLDAADLLATQQGSIIESLPGGFFDLLQREGIIDAFGASAVEAATGRPQRAAARAAPVPSRRSAPLPEPRRNAAWLATLLVLFVLLVLLGLAWSFSNPSAQPAIAPGPAPGQAALDVRRFSAAFESIRNSLAGVRNPATAEAALPGLEAGVVRLERLSTSFGAAPAEQQAAILGLVGPTARTTSSLSEEVLTLPGVAPILQSTAKTLETQLALFSMDWGLVGTG